MRTYQEYVSSFREEAQYLMGQQVTELKLRCLYDAVPHHQVYNEFCIHLDLLDQQLQQSINYIVEQAKEQKQEQNILKSELTKWYQEYKEKLLKKMRV